MTAAQFPIRSFACPHCGVAVQTARVRQHTCGASRCRKKRQWLFDKHDPAKLLARRARLVRWAAEHRNVRGSNPWLYGQLAYHAHLPGAGVELSLSPHPAWLTDHSRTLPLHGLLTALLGGGRDTSSDDAWALVPWPRGCGWAVYLWDAACVERLAGLSFDAALAGDRVHVTFGPAGRIRAPAVRRGRRRVRIDALTPVVTRRAGTPWSYTAPSASTLLHTLEQTLARRLGAPLPSDPLRLSLLERKTEPRQMACGKYGTVRGWVGHAVVEANAPSRWLLECAARGPGLGRWTALGFGRVRVTEAD